MPSHRLESDLGEQGAVGSNLIAPTNYPYSVSTFSKQQLLDSQTWLPFGPISSVSSFIGFGTTGSQGRTGPQSGLPIDRRLDGQGNAGALGPLPGRYRSSIRLRAGVHAAGQKQSACLANLLEPEYGQEPAVAMERGWLGRRPIGYRERTCEVPTNVKSDLRLTLARAP